MANLIISIILILVGPVAWANEGGEDAAKTNEKSCAILAEDAKRDESKLTEDTKQQHLDNCPQFRAVPLKPLKAEPEMEARPTTTPDNSQENSSRGSASPSGENSNATEPAPPGPTRIGGFEDYPDETKKGMGATGSGAAFRAGYLDMQQGREIPESRFEDQAYLDGAASQRNELKQTLANNPAPIQDEFGNQYNQEGQRIESVADPYLHKLVHNAEDTPRLYTPQTVEEERAGLERPEFQQVALRGRESIVAQTGVEGRLSSPFGWRTHPIHGDQRFHAGVDMAAPEGTPVRSAAAGTVTFAGRAGGYGNLVIVKHDNGIETRYAHLTDRIDMPVVGTRVGQGDLLGGVGTTGGSTGNHLHYEVRIGGRAIDPAGHGGDVIAALNNGDTMPAWVGNVPSMSSASGGVKMGNRGFTTFARGQGYAQEYEEEQFTPMYFAPPSLGGEGNITAPSLQQSLPVQMPQAAQTPQPLTEEELKKQAEELKKRQEFLEAMKPNAVNPNLLEGAKLDDILKNEVCKNLRGADLLTKPECLGK